MVFKVEVKIELTRIGLRVPYTIIIIDLNTFFQYDFAKIRERNTAGIRKCNLLFQIY